MRRAIVVGGSLGGLFAACMLHRSGWDVIVARAGRGAACRARRRARRASADAARGCSPPAPASTARVGIAIGGRAALARDGSIAAEIAMPQFCTSWARLYSLLSDVFPEERVRRGVGARRLRAGRGRRHRRLVGRDEPPRRRARRRRRRSLDRAPAAPARRRARLCRLYRLARHGRGRRAVAGDACGAFPSLRLGADPTASTSSATPFRAPTTT